MKAKETTLEDVKRRNRKELAELKQARREKLKAMRKKHELANMIARQVSAITEKKEESERQPLEQHRYKTRAVEAARNECDMEIKRYKEKAEGEKEGNDEVNQT